MVVLSMGRRPSEPMLCDSLPDIKVSDCVGEHSAQRWPHIISAWSVKVIPLHKR